MVLEVVQRLLHFVSLFFLSREERLSLVVVWLPIIKQCWIGRDSEGDPTCDRGVTLLWPGRGRMLNGFEGTVCFLPVAEVDVRVEVERTGTLRMGVFQLSLIVLRFMKVACQCLPVSFG